MKKTIKTVVSMLIAIIIACGSITAFASDSAEITWVNSGKKTIYSYGGALKVGRDSQVSATEESEYVYYTVEIDEAGYYKFTVTEDNGVGGFAIPEEHRNGKYYGETERYTHNHEIFVVYYLEEGEHVVGFEMYEQGAGKVLVKYLGDVVDIRYTESVLDDCRVGYNLCESDNAGVYTVEADMWIDFSNGDGIFDEYSYFYIYTDEKLESGEYEVEISNHFFNRYTEKAAINVTKTSEEVADVDIDNLDEYKDIAYYYTCELISSASDCTDLTVTYADGSTEVVEGFDGFEILENGMRVKAFYDSCGNGNWRFVITVDNVVVLSEECSVRNATLKENFELYQKLNREYIRTYFSSLFSFGNNDSDDNLEDVRSEIISNLILNTTKFAEFYLAGHSAG